MGRFIPENTNAERVFEAVHGMFSTMVSTPAVDRSGKLDDGLSIREDLLIANKLLATLEELYCLKIDASGRYTNAGVQTQSMHQEYVQMKHWQRMLNGAFGVKEDG